LRKKTTVENDNETNRNDIEENGLLNPGLPAARSESSGPNF